MTVKDKDAISKRNLYQTDMTKRVSETRGLNNENSADKLIETSGPGLTQRDMELGIDETGKESVDRTNIVSGSGSTERKRENDEE